MSFPPARAGAAATGFTLIELLVVVAILSAASLLAFGSLGEDRLQLRHDDTRQRLLLLRNAVLGQSGPSAAASAVSGFVADNGRLPADLATLLGAGSLEPRAPRAAIFDPQPDASSCENDGSSNDLTLLVPAALLIKGHAGDYLAGQAINGRFRDGWGNVASSDDALNFGWQLSHDAAGQALEITSYGMDNAAGGSDFAADRQLSVNAGDWLLPLAGWTVTVRNLTGHDINANSDGLSVSLLVYVNTTSGGRWRRHATTTLACLDAYGASSDGLCLDASGNTVPGGHTVSASFIDGCQPGISQPGLGLIPQGRHLLVLSRNAGTSPPWSGTDRLTWSTPPAISQPILRQVDVIAGHNLPSLTLEIR